METRPTIYVCNTGGALALDRGNAQDNGLLFRKKLIYTGKFVKNIDGKEQRFGVTRDLLAHWRSTFDKFKAKGIRVPVPIGHVDSAENTRGEVIELELADEPDGVSALYGTIRFRDAEAAKMANTGNDVSLFVPPEFVDGVGEKHTRPITHVALTPYPVIPGLGNFQPIVASFKLDLNKGIAMSLQTLAEKLAIPFADKDDATVEAEIFTKFQSFSAEIDKLKAKIVELGGEVDGAAPTPDAEAVAASFKPSAAMVGLLRDNRQNKLDALLRDGKITPAQMKELQKEWLADNRLTLSLSHSGNDAAPSDTAWDNVVKTLELSTAVKLGERTTAQRVPTGDDNPLLKDAQRRRKLAEEQRKR